MYLRRADQLSTPLYSEILPTRRHALWEHAPHPTLNARPHLQCPHGGGTNEVALSLPTLLRLNKSYIVPLSLHSGFAKRGCVNQRKPEPCVPNED